MFFYIFTSGSGGRTGAFIALDALIGHLSKSEYIDVFGTVLHLRNSRQNMVSTVVRYHTVFS